MAKAAVIGKVYTHIESGRQVIVTGTGKMLADSHWVKSVTYTTLDNNSAWTRDEKSFGEKFSIVTA